MADPISTNEKSTLVALRDRLAKATGPNWALECEIGEVLAGLERYVVPPKYTASIDAAVTLVPKSALWKLENMWMPPGNEGGCCILVTGSAYQHVQAATPALALCLARVEYEIAKAEGDAGKTNTVV